MHSIKFDYFNSLPMDRVRNALVDIDPAYMVHSEGAFVLTVFKQGLPVPITSQLWNAIIIAVSLNVNSDVTYADHTIPSGWLKAICPFITIANREVIDSSIHNSLLNTLLHLHRFGSIVLDRDLDSKVIQLWDLVENPLLAGLQERYPLRSVYHSKWTCSRVTGNMSSFLETIDIDGKAVVSLGERVALVGSVSELMEWV